MGTRKIVVMLLILVIAASVSTAADFKDRSSFGVRLPFFMPVYNGADFTTPTGNRQPFMMGWDFGIEAKRGISNRMMIGFTANYLSADDNDSSLDNAGDGLTNTDHATAKLTGLAFGLQGYWYYDPIWRFQPYLLGGVGVDLWKVKNIATDVSHNATDIDLKFGTGLMFPITDQVSLDAQIKLTVDLINISENFPAGFYGPDTWKKYKNRPFRGYLEPSIGLTFLFGGATDSDGDGVPDKRDKCPNTPKGVKVDQFGCPLDSDGDGVPDYLDKCPDTPKGVKVDAVGCPLDSDGDGVPDYLDKCPDTPKGVKVDASGCPLDSDGDGVPDYLDKCPGTPKGIPVDENGCPKMLKKGEKLTLHINFPTNSFEIDSASKVILDGVAETMKSFPEIKIRVGGFTDNSGSAGHNQRLSENRAKAVVTYLESKGVQTNRVSAKGYGEDPKYFVGDNATEQGKAQNRRVELESVE